MADMELPWPSVADTATLRIVAAGSARSASLARFLAAAFLALALLLLLVGLSKRHHAALAGAGGFLLAAASCFAASRPARPVLLLNREKGEILLSRRWLGRLKFRVFPADQIDLRAERNGSFCRLRIVPRLGNGAGGRPLVNGSSHPLDVSDKAWQAGMLLTCRADAGPISDLLRAWLRHGSAPESGDTEEYTAALNGRELPPEVEAWARPASYRGRSNSAAPGRNMDETPDEEGSPGPAARHQAAKAVNPSTPRRPEIRRAGELRDTTRGRDKRS
ncbi:MAG: hypothetical protein KH208_13740 [Desulfovibrio sp.]|nr:hypothetical protein [Desulfovibrio sp.]